MFSVYSNLPPTFVTSFYDRYLTPRTAFGATGEKSPTLLLMNIEIKFKNTMSISLKSRNIILGIVTVLVVIGLDRNSALAIKTLVIMVLNGCSTVLRCHLGGE